jgi:hypothetical protein
MLCFLNNFHQTSTLIRGINLPASLVSLAMPGTQPTERPYEATRYTYLTDTQGLTAVESNGNLQEISAEKRAAYEKSAKAFQTEDEKAHSAYKDSGSVVDNGFLKWARENVSLSHKKLLYMY